MRIKLNCPVCGAVNGFDQDQASKMGKCGECSTPMYIPEQEELPRTRRSRQNRDDDERRPGRVGNANNSGRTAMIVAVSALGVSALFFLVLLIVGIWWIAGGKPQPPIAIKIEEKPKDLFESAPVVKLDANIAAAHDGKIEPAKSETMIKVKAPINGTLAIQFDSDSKLDGRLFVYNAAKTELAQNSSDADLRIGQLFVPVEKDKEYYVKAACADDKTGPFKLSLTTLGDVGNTMETALEVKLSRKGEAVHNWKIEPVGDVDYFRFTAPHDGQMAIELKQGPASQLDSALTVFGPSRLQITSHIGNAAWGPRNVRFFVETGKTYFVKVDAVNWRNGINNQVGAYTLTYRLEKGSAAPNGFAAARDVIVNNFGTSTFSSIAQPNDLQYFRFTAVTTGTMIVNLHYPADSQLDAYMIGYDVNKKDLGYNEVSLSLPVFANNTYYVKVGAKAVPAFGLARTGGFELKFTPNNFNKFNPPAPVMDNFNNAQQLFMNNGFGNVGNQFKLQFENHMYKVQADRDGLLLLQAKPNANNFFSLRTQVYDGLKIPLGLDTGGTKELVVANGGVYYVKVFPSAFAGGNLGGYSLSASIEKIQPDDYGNDFTTAHEIALADGNSKTSAGCIEVPADLDYFRFKAPDTGWINVSCGPAVFSQLDQKLNCFDDLKRDVSIPYFPVEKGKTYYARVSSWSEPLSGRRSTGTYNLTVRFDKTLFDDFGNDFNTAATLKLQQRFTFSSGRIETKDDVDFFRFEANSTGTMSIKLFRPFGSQFNGHLFVYDKDKNLVSDSDKDAFNFGAVQPFMRHLNIQAVFGQTYYIKVAPAKGALQDQIRGCYNLDIDSNPFNKGFGGKKKIGNPNPNFNPVGGKGALILNVNDNLAVTDKFDPTRDNSYCKIFTVKMTQNKTYTIDMESAQIDSYLRLVDNLGIEVARNDDFFGGVNPLDSRIVHIPTTSGTFTIYASSYRASETGPFALRVREE